MSKKILVVDDEKDICDFLKQLIEVQSDYEVVIGLNGEEGFKLYKEHMPDAVLTDVKMPIRDGLWLSDRIRDENKNIPILIMTGFTSVAQSEFELRNIADVLRKPDDTANAFDFIEKALLGSAG